MMWTLSSADGCTALPVSQEAEGDEASPGFHQAEAGMERREVGNLAKYSGQIDTVLKHGVVAIVLKILLS